MKLIKFLAILIYFSISLTNVNAEEATGSVTVIVSPQTIIEVIDEPVVNEYTITTTATSGGKVTPLGVTKVKEGSDQDILFSLDPGFQILSIVIDGKALDAYPSSKLSFKDIKSNHSVDFSFVDKNKIGISLNASISDMFLPDNSTVLNWKTSGSPDECIASGDWSGVKNSTSGSQTLTGLKAGEYNFIITCKKTGVANASDSIKVNVRNMYVLLNIAGNPTISLPENKTTLQWVVFGNADSCLASGAWSGYKSTQTNMPHQENITLPGAGIYNFDILCKKGKEESSSRATLTILGGASCKNLPLTRNVSVACDPKNGVDAISGSVIRTQTKIPPSCIFEEPITVNNSTYVSDNCVYPDLNSCVWDTEWLPSVNNCPISTVQTKNCVNVYTGNIIKTDTRNVNLGVSDCPSLNLRAEFGGKEILSTQKIPYNSKPNIKWNTSKVNFCSCTYLDKDSNKEVSCGSSLNGNLTPILKQDRTYKVSCVGQYDINISDSVKVLVDKINTNYIEPGI